MSNMKSWNLKKIKKSTAARWSILLTTCLSVSLFSFFKKTAPYEISSFCLLVLIAQLGSASIIGCIFIRDRRKNRAISIDGETLLVPRLFGPTKKIPTGNIKSIEDIKIGNRITAIQLGRLNNTTVIIESCLFIGEKDFLDFLDTLQLLIKEKKPLFFHEAAPQKSLSIFTDHAIVGTLSLILFSTYLFYSDLTFSFLTQKSLSAGGLPKELKIDDIYKFASFFFLHANPYHLGLNIISLAVLGKNVLHIFGIPRAANIFFWSGLTGAFLSLAYSDFNIVIGCSGGIMGLVASCWIANLLFPKNIPGSVTISNQQIVIILALQLSIDLLFENSNTMGHLGGFLFGCFYAKLVSLTLGPLKKSSLIEKILFFITVLFFTSSLLHFYELK